MMEEKQENNPKIENQTPGMSEKSEKQDVLRIRIVEDPLTAQTLGVIVSALTSLHTKFWLIQQGRFAELLDYHDNPATNPMPEASLLIKDMRYHSPVELHLVSFVANPVLIGEALRLLVRVFRIAVEAITQAPHKQKQNQLLEQEIKLKEQQFQLRQERAEQQLLEAAQRAELENERIRLEIERQRLLLQIEVQRTRLQADKERVDFALDLADKVIRQLYPDADDDTRAMVSRTLLPELLQLGKIPGFELALPAPQANQPEI